MADRLTTSLEGLLADANLVNLGGRNDLYIASAKHLIAMKFHAMKENSERMEEKDILDVIALTKAESIDLSGDEFRQLAEKYGNMNVYEQIKKRAS